MAEFEEALSLLRQGKQEDALHLFEQGSKQDFRCSYHLANLYFTGAIGKKDVDQATKYFDLAFEQASQAEGDVAEYVLGTFYLFGLGTVTADKEKGIEYLKASAEKKNIDACILLSNCYRSGNGVEADPKKSYELIAPIKDSGHPAAYRIYADCLFFGSGVEKDVKTAIAYYKKASDRNDARSMFQLGTCYYEANGVEKDDKIAYDYFLSSAKLGFPDAMKNLAYFYANGIGVEKSQEEEVNWLMKYSATGRPDGMYTVARMFLEKSNKLYRYADAVTLLKRAVDMNYAPASHFLGRLYETGNYGLLPNMNIAFNLYAKSYKDGFKEAARDLLRFYREGKYVKPNPNMMAELEKVIQELDAHKA